MGDRIWSFVHSDKKNGITISYTKKDRFSALAHFVKIF